MAQRARTLAAVDLSPVPGPHFVLSTSVCARQTCTHKIHGTKTFRNSRRLKEFNFRFHKMAVTFTTLG